MSWEKYAYTSAGAAMLSESISGGALTITRAVSGTGTVDTDLSEETAVSGDTYELKLLGIDTVEYKGEKPAKSAFGRAVQMSRTSCTKSACLAASMMTRRTRCSF